MSDVRIEEPFPLHRLPEAYDWSRRYWRHVAHDGIPKNFDEWFVMHATALFDPCVRSWGVWRGDELGGFLWAVIDRWIARPHCIFKRTFWGYETTLASIRLGIDQVFRDGVTKIEMWCYEDNARAMALYRALGCVQEGCLSRQVRRDGEYTSMNIWGLSKEEEQNGRSSNGS